MVYILLQDDLFSENFNFKEENGNLIFEYNGNYDANYNQNTSILTIKLDDNKQVKFKILNGQIYIYVPTGTPRKWGEYLVSKFDSETSMNIFYPKTPSGQLLYHLYGFAFDNFEEKILQFQLNLSPITCSYERLNEYAKEFRFEINNLNLTDMNEIRAYIIRHKYNTRSLKTLNEVIKKIELFYNEELKTFLDNEDDIESEILEQRLTEWENYKPCIKKNSEFIKNNLFNNIEWSDISEKFYKYGKKKTIPTLY